MPRRQQPHRREGRERERQRLLAGERGAETLRERSSLRDARVVHGLVQHRRGGRDDRAASLPVREVAERPALDAHLDVDHVAAEGIVAARRTGRRGDAPAPVRPLRVLEERAAVQQRARQRTSGMSSSTVLGVPWCTTLTRKRHAPGIATLSGKRWCPPSRAIARCRTMPCSMAIIS